MLYKNRIMIWKYHGLNYVLHVIETFRGDVGNLKNLDGKSKIETVNIITPINTRCIKNEHY